GPVVVVGGQAVVVEDSAVPGPRPGQVVLVAVARRLRLQGPRRFADDSWAAQRGNKRRPARRALHIMAQDSLGRLQPAPATRAVDDLCHPLLAPRDRGPDRPIRPPIRIIHPAAFARVFRFCAWASGGWKRQGATEKKTGRHWSAMSG